MGKLQIPPAPSITGDGTSVFEKLVRLVLDITRDASMLYALRNAPENLSPGSLSSAIFAFTSQYMGQINRVLGYLPPNTQTVSEILLEKFPSLADTDSFSCWAPELGVPISIPLPCGGELAEDNLCLVFCYNNGTLIFGERTEVRAPGQGEKLSVLTLDKEGLTVLLERFPELKSVLVNVFLR